MAYIIEVVTARRAHNDPVAQAEQYLKINVEYRRTMKIVMQI